MPVLSKFYGIIVRMYRELYESTIRRISTQNTLARKSSWH